MAGLKRAKAAVFQFGPISLQKHTRSTGSQIEFAGSVNKLAWACGVNLLECEGSALVKYSLFWEASVLIVSVGCHAPSESFEVELTELVKDVLAG